MVMFLLRNRKADPRFTDERRDPRKDNVWPGDRRLGRVNQTCAGLFANRGEDPFDDKIDERVQVRALVLPLAVERQHGDAVN